MRRRVFCLLLIRFLHCCQCSVGARTAWRKDVVWRPNDSEIRVMEGGSDAQNVGNGGVGGLEGGSSSMEARLCKERRRRERRERRARRQQRNSLISQMDGCIYEQAGVHHGVPDLLHHHLPPPAYTTLPGRGRPTACPQRNINPTQQHSWRENLPAFARR